MACREGSLLSLFASLSPLLTRLLPSGKTSLIHSLAGELGLDIYVVSLSSKGYGDNHTLNSVTLLTSPYRSMSDNTLTTLMGHVPTR